ncbi:MAG: TSUP family transporter [Bifidobacteriaceae bacterium]|nr:TSUP family transporter [Bifidobacteriaceae bacterium]
MDALASISPTGWAIILIGALCAGWIDAVIGGGGLVLIPLIMAGAPGLEPVVALASNKFAACFGTASAAFTLNKKLGFRRKDLIYVPIALGFSAIGALIASSINKEILRPAVIVLLLIAGLIVVFKPNFGAGEGHINPRRWWWTLPAVALIALYDGSFGPGTGMFLIMAFSALVAQDFLHSAATAKLINTCTNIGALVMFIIHGDVLFPLAIAAAVANIIGAQLGARTVLKSGPKFIRYALLSLVVIMCVYLGWQQIK